MLHQSSCLPIGRMITLQALGEGNNHRAIEICVLAVAFLVSAPARITPQVCVGRPDYYSALLIVGALKNVTSFVALNVSHLFHSFGIPGFSKSDSLRECCTRNGERLPPFSWTTLSKPVNTFDVSTSFDTEARHAWIGIETFDLFFKRH